jgi:hypothetical protein
MTQLLGPHWELLDHNNLCVIFASAYAKNDIDTIVKLINFGFNINGDSVLYIIKYYSNDTHSDILKIILNHGFNLNLVGQGLLKHFIQNRCHNIIKLLFQYGVNFDCLNKIAIPKEHDDMYNLLVDLEISPKIISFLLVQLNE